MERIEDAQNSATHRCDAAVDPIDCRTGPESIGASEAGRSEFVAHRRLHPLTGQETLN